MTEKQFADKTFADKTFEDCHKNAKFAKVFSLESFRLYGIHSIPSVGVVAHTRGAVCCLDLPFGERL